MKEEKEKPIWETTIQEFYFYPLPVKKEDYDINEKLDKFLTDGWEIISVLEQKRVSVTPEKYHFIFLAKNNIRNY